MFGGVTEPHETDVSNDLNDTKEMNRRLYVKHKKGRKNVREERKRKFVEHKRKRKACTSKAGISLDNVKPHAQEEPDDYDHTESIFSLRDYSRDGPVIYEDDMERVPDHLAVWSETGVPVRHDPLCKYSSKEDWEANAMPWERSPTGSVCDYNYESSDEEIDESSCAERLIEFRSQLPSITIERNAMAHIVADVDAFDKSDAKLAGLLSSVHDVDSFAADVGEGVEIGEWLGHLENLVILGYQMNKACSFMQVFMAAAAFAKMYSNKKSILMDLYRIINEVTTVCGDEDVNPHATEQESSKRNWTGRSVLDSWEMLKTNTIFNKISYLISAVMSLAVCTTKKIEWSPMGLQLISLEAAKEQLKAVDVIDAIVKTFVWISETGWRCFETRSIAPLLYSDQKVAEYNNDCDYVLAKADAALAGNIDDLGAFEKRLNSVYKRTCIMKKAKNNGPTALWLQKRYSDLVAILERLSAKRKNTDIRFQPLGFSLHGATGVGKTTLGKITMTQALAAMGFVSDDGEVDDSRISTMDMSDKYQSTYTSDILGVFMDDLNNTKSDFQKDNPHTSVIIKFFNNVAAQAIKAELNEKGVVFIDFKVGIITANIKDLGAREYSNCPESILRRFIHVEVKIKEEYCKPGTTMLNKQHPDIRKSTSLVQDIWELKIEEIETYEVSPNKTAYKFVPMTVFLDDGRKIVCEKLGLEDYLDVIIQLSKDHKDAQDSLITKSKNSAQAKFCKTCKKFPEYCKCITTPIVPHAVDILSEVLVDASRKAMNSYIKSWTRPVDLINRVVGFMPVRKMATAQLAKEIQCEMNNKGTPLLVAITPQWLFKTAAFQRSVYAWQSAAAYYDVRRPMRFCGFASLSLLGSGLYKKNKLATCTGVAASWFTVLAGYYMHQVRVKKIQEAYLQKRDALPAYAKKIRDGKFPKSVLFAATLTLGVKLIKMWNENRLKTNPQSLTPEDIDNQPGWFGHLMKQIGVITKSSVTGAIPAQVLKTGEKNLGWCDFTRSDGSTTSCNIIYPEKGYVWFPLHVFYPQSDMTKKRVDYVQGVVFRSENKKTSKFKFTAQLDFNTVCIDEIDMVECFVERCPDITTKIKKFLPLAQPKGISICTLMVRDKNARIDHEKFTVEHGKYGHKFKTMMGGCYTTTKATTGSCMGILVTEGKQPVVAGFHIGGIKEKQVGVSMTVTQNMANELRTKLLKLPGIRGIATATELPNTQYGTRIIDSTRVHPNSKFIIALDETAAIDVLGSTRLRASTRSKVIPSILRKETERLFKIENCWGEPKLQPNWEAYNATLEHIINPSEIFVPSKMLRARQDWINPILEFAKTINAKDSVRPLSMQEIVMGVPGKRFLDPLVMNTSTGFPLFGAKSKYFTDVEVDGLLVDRTPSPEIIAEYKRCLACWERGERAYPVCSASLKDEPTKHDSNKVRVFQAVAIALSFGIRRWFLPIARVLSLCPELSESAVGVNAFSPQWDALMSHAEKFADDKRVVAWDYSKYDVRMNSQMTYAVLQSFIDIAEVCSYTPHDLEMMNVMIADIIHPLIDYNGTMIMAYNMNTSGNNITVNINDIANSIYVRMGFFEACPEVKDFRAAVAALTYGDDFIGSVKKEYRKRFNFSTFKEFLAQHGMKITNPNKTDDVFDDMDVEDADFLKRKSQYIPEIDCRLGALCKESMYKPLLANLRSSSEDEIQVAASCVQTYMHELFAHGKEEYDHDQALMKELCANVLQFTPPAVNFSFEERVDEWKKKYL
jgi:hypothetical protein